MVFRSFYGSSEPGTPFHHDSIPSNPLRPLPEVGIHRLKPVLPTIIVASMATVTGLPEVKKHIDDERVPLYNVVLLDDDEHSYEYVIEMLQKLFAKSAEQGFQHAREV